LARHRAKRFNELRGLMPDIPHKVLAATLRSLEDEDLVLRKVLSELRLQVEYAISAHGQSVRPLIHSVARGAAGTSRRRDRS
jgi:DNA-binding HxlR family transcriptional regulator